MSPRYHFIFLELVFIFFIPLVIVLLGFRLSETPEMAYSLWIIFMVFCRGCMAIVFDIYSVFKD